MPEALRVRLLTTSEQNRLDEAAQEDYWNARDARVEWVASHYMRVPAWGGLKAPGSRYTFESAACEAWYRTSLGRPEE